MPWQAKREDEAGPVWRYTENPIIGRHGNSISNSVFNSAVVPFENGYAGVFRCDSVSISMDIFTGFSEDGIHWKISNEPIVFAGADAEILKKELKVLESYETFDLPPAPISFRLHLE